MKYKLSIDGMACANCVKHVTEALKEAGGTEIKIELENKCAYVSFENPMDDSKLKNIIDDAGYDLIAVAALV